MKIYCNVDTVKYSTKPSGNETAIIQNRMTRPRHIELPRLADRIASGCTFRCSAVEGNDDSEWQSQQLYGLDFDNKGKYITLDDAIRIAKDHGIPPVIVYETFGSEANHQRFRMLFCTATATNDIRVRNRVQRYLETVFSGYIDESTTNPARLFYGTDKGIIYADYDARINLKTVLEATTEEPIGSRTKADIRQNGNVDAIRNHDAEYLRKVLNRPKRIFENRSQFYDYLYHEANLAELLGVPERKNFRCFFHDDRKPSASVFQENKFGIWKYHCFSGNCKTNGKNLNIKQVVELLGGFKSEYQALEFIKSIYNCEIEVTEWAKEQTENIDLIISSLNNSDSAFEEICPTASSNISRYKGVFTAILCVARESIFPDVTSADGNIIFYLSARQLAKRLGKSNPTKINNYIKMLAYHGLLEILPDDQIPKAYLKKALAWSENGHNHIQFYRVPSWVIQQLQIIERQGVKWKEHRYRVNGISYEMFLRSEGKDIAKKLYPQTSCYTDVKGKVHQKKTTKQADELHLIIAETLLDQIERQGYSTEKELFYAVLKSNRIRKMNREAETRIGYNIVDRQIKRSMTEILDSYGLKKVRANNRLKEQFGIISTGYPAVIIKEADVLQ